MTMRNRSCLFSWLAVLMLASASAAPAQESKAPPNALQGFSQNKNEPVNIKSASLEVQDRNKMATFTGNVHLVQGDTTLRCKVLVVYYDADQTTGGPAVKSAAPGPTGSSQIRRMEAKGNVIVTQKDQTASGELGIYDVTDQTVTLSTPGGGKVSVTQGPNILRSPRLVVHLDTGISHFVGGVEALFNPESNKRDNASGPAAPAAGGTKTAPPPKPSR
jgi:lipopolysaccharide export system protein LptA